MNRKKSEAALSLSTIIVLFVGGIFLAASGVFYVAMKNKQVKVLREIAGIQKRISEHEVAIKMHRADIEKHLGRVSLKQCLQKLDTGLVDIPPGIIQTCPRQPRAVESSVVSRD